MKYQPETILAYAAAQQMTPADQQLIPQALELLRNTRDYVQKIRRLYGTHEHPYNPQFAAPSPLLATTRAARM